MTISLLAIVSALAQTTPVLSTGSLPVDPTLEQSENAGAGPSTILDIEGSAGYSSNPQLGFNSSAQGFGRLSVYAAHSRQGERSTTVLSLYGENATYSGRSGSQQLLRATASHQVAVTEKLRMFGDLSASLSITYALGM